MPDWGVPKGPIGIARGCAGWTGSDQRGGMTRPLVTLIWQDLTSCCGRLEQDGLLRTDDKGTRLLIEPVRTQQGSKVAEQRRLAVLLQR